MMNKPANWDSVEAITGEYKKLPAGGLYVALLELNVLNLRWKRDVKTCNRYCRR